MAYTPFKMKGNPMQRNFGIGMRDKNTLPHGAKKSPAKKGHKSKTLVAKSDSMDVAHDKFMKDRMKVLQDKAQKSADSLQTVRKRVINKAVDKKTEAIDKEDSRSKQKKMTSDLGKEIKALNEKRSGAKMMKKSPNKMGHKSPAKMGHKSPTKMGHKSPAKLKKEDSPTKMGHKSPSKMKKSAMKMKKDDSAMKMKKESAMKMKKAPTKFNKGLKAAAAAGKLDKNPKFKAAVEGAPAKMKKKSAMKMKKSAMKMKMKKSPAKMGHKKK